MGVQISKSGLGYFPLPVIIIYDRAMKRLMKKEGDGAMAVVINVLSMIYAGEGYYVKADELLYEDISANLFDGDVDMVKRVVEMAVKHGMFDEAMFKKHQVLTSLDIQRHYVYSTRRRLETKLDTEFCLLEASELPNKESVKRDAERRKASRTKAAPYADNHSADTESLQIREEKSRQDKKRTDETEKETPPSIPQGEGAERGEENLFDCLLEDMSSNPVGKDNAKNTQPKPTAAKRSAMTLEDIEALIPPADGVPRNFEGLILMLQPYRIKPTELYAIVCKSNYGMIGHKVWLVINQLHVIGSKIKLPGRYILSEISKG